LNLTSKVVLFCALALPLPALAQDAPRAELSAGYAYARIDKVNLHGGYGALDLSLGRSLGLEVQAAVQSGGSDGTDVDRTTLLAGPRFAWRRGGVTPFVHALGGVVRDSSGLDVFEVSIRVKDTNAAGVLGGGLDLPLGRSWAVRVQADYLLQGGEGDSEATRAAVGLVYRAGSK
jgi:outer membrane protein with beta-barrel domain